MPQTSIQPYQKTTVLTATYYFEVKSVNLNNHTAIAKLDLELYGIQNVTLGEKSIHPDFVFVQITDSNNDVINCSLSGDYGNGTYSYKGTLNDVNWYLYNFGEGYPYDPTFIEVRIIGLEYAMGQSRYGASVFDNYSYNVGYTQVTFNGINYDDLQYTWKISKNQDADILHINFDRIWLTPTFIIMFPLIWLIGLVIFAPSLTNNRTHRITLYSSILVFAPMFIFAIQTFISPRGSPSVPEFMGVMLMLMSVMFLLAALPRRLTRAETLLLDSVIIITSFIFIGFFGIFVFIRLIIFQSLTIVGVLGLLLGLIVFGYVWRIRAYDKQTIRLIEREAKERLKILNEEENNRLSRLREQEVV